MSTALSKSDITGLLDLLGRQDLVAEINAPLAGFRLVGVSGTYDVTACTHHILAQLTYTRSYQWTGAVAPRDGRVRQDYTRSVCKKWRFANEEPGVPDPW